MNDPGPLNPLAASCYFEELRIRARSPWHREQYNQHLQQARSTGATPDEARAFAIHKMTDSMSDSGVRPATR